MRSATALADELVLEAVRDIPSRPDRGKGPTTGTVIIGFPYNRGIMLAADRQATWGHKIWRTNVQKIQPVGDFFAVAGCGTVAMCQWIPEVYAQIVGRVEMNFGSTLPLRGRVRIFGNLMRGFAQAYGDAGADFIFAGLDPRNREAALLEFDSDGSKFIPNTCYLTHGSGYLEADGVLKNYFEDEGKTAGETDLKAAMALSLKAIRRAAETDTGVGHPSLGSATLAVIDAQVGFRFVPEEEIKALIVEEDVKRMLKGARQ